MTFVDIRDVAKAHLSAGLDAKWHGRNLICSCSDTFMQLGQMVRTECQFENVATGYCPYCPLMCVPSAPLGKQANRETGFVYRESSPGVKRVLRTCSMQGSGSMLMHPPRALPMLPCLTREVQLRVPNLRDE
jgi:hypothetical protein